jgi:hypothetical protein
VDSYRVRVIATLTQINRMDDCWIASEQLLQVQVERMTMSAFGHKRPRQAAKVDVRFSNRPVEVKRFQTHHDCGVDVTCGLALLFGLGTLALPSWDSRTRWNNLYRGLAVRVGRSKRTCELTSSTVPQGTPFHRLVELEFSPIELDPERPHAAASLVHLNSVPSVQMRCIITAKRRASATIAFFIPRCLAIFIAQALSQDHFAERNSMTWAAS